MSFWKRNREKISGIGLIILFGVGTWSVWSGYKRRAHIEEVGIRTIGHVFESYHYKGSHLRYYYFYKGKKYVDSHPTDKRFPTHVGDKRCVVFDTLNPKKSHPLWHEIIDSVHSLDLYQGKPIVINP